MGVFDKKAQVRYSTEKDAENWYFILNINDENIVFPINLESKNIRQLMKQSDNNELFALSELFYSGLATFDGVKLALPYSRYEEVDVDLINELNLPKAYSGDLILDSFSYVGSGNFKVKIGFQTQSGHPIWNYKLTGQIINFNNQEFYLNKQIMELFSLSKEIELYEKERKIEESYKVLAELKEISEENGYKVSEYIDSQELVFENQIELDIIKTADDEIELRPYLKKLNLDDLETLVKNGYKSNMLKTDNQKRKRVFIDDKCIQDLKSISKKTKFKGIEAANFISNPYQYIDENIIFDRDKFSERVKGIRIVSYKAKPFINANENPKLNWFEFQSGVVLTPTIEGMETFTLTNDEFDKLRSSQSNPEMLVYNGESVEYSNDDFDQYFENIQKLKKEAPDFKLPYSTVRRVLDIFENIENIEYRSGIINAFEKIRDANIMEYIQPTGLTATLHPHQKNGFLWLQSLAFLKLGGLLADDMGLGKTLQVITFMQELKNKSDLKPSLIVLPVALLNNWIYEINKFATGITCEIFHKEYGRLDYKFNQSDVYITTYETLVNNQLILGQIPWKIVVCDEAQKIKNSSTYASVAVKAMKGEHRIALTGTPVENGLHELWSIMDFVQPGLLESYQNFKETYELPIHKGDMETATRQADLLLDELKAVYLRRTKEEELEGLPKIISHQIPVEMTKIQYQMYIEMIMRGKDNPAMQLAIIGKLLQLCDHPDTIVVETLGHSKSLLEGSNKLVKTKEILDEIRKKGEKVLIFTKYRKMQKILISLISKEYGIYPMVINGEVNGDRNLLINQFERIPGFNVMILSPRAAGMGLNITCANHVIHYSRDWNPAVEKQATDRVYRIGQTKDVHVYYPIVTLQGRETVEEKLSRLLQRKMDIITKVIVPADQFKVKNEELLDLF